MYIEEIEMMVEWLAVSVFTLKIQLICLSLMIQCLNLVKLNKHVQFDLFEMTSILLVVFIDPIIL